MRSRGVLIVFDDDPEVQGRLEDLFGNEYEIVCEPDLVGCEADEESTVRVLRDIDPQAVKGIIVDLSDDAGRHQGKFPGERIYRRIRNRFPKGESSVCVVVMSVLVNEEGRIKEDRLSHIPNTADAVLSKTDASYGKLSQLIRGWSV